MIVFLSAIAIAGGLLAGRMAAVRMQRKGSLPPGQSLPPNPGPSPRLRGEGSADESSDESFRPPPPEVGGRPGGGQTADAGTTDIDWTPFPCSLGDVVVRTSDSTEVWLAGAVVLREDAPAAVLFIAPDASGERAIYARPRPSAEIAWLALVPGGATTAGAEPPTTLEIDGVRFERARRLPLHAQRVGTGTPDVAETVIVGEYAAASGEVAIVLVSSGVAHAWRGRRLREGEFDVWGGGEGNRDKRDKRTGKPKR